MTILTNEADLRKIRGSGDVIKTIFDKIEKWIRPGVTTAFLDQEAEKIIRACKAEPAFKGYRGYPASICASVNDVVVHGIPSESIILLEGDIVGIDVGVRKSGYFTDAARTFAVGEISSGAKKLIDITRHSLSEAIKQAVAGKRVEDISKVVQTIARTEKVEEVRTFVGHGIGKRLHESPEVPNWCEDRRKKSIVLKEGMVLAIEPMLNAGTREVKVLSDGWTAVTLDGKLSAHFEDTIIVGKEKAEIIT